MKETYYWVPWFRELSRKIAKFEDGRRSEFLELAKDVNWDDGGKVKGQVERLKEEFDPFTFIYMVANKHGTKSRETVYGSISEVFELHQSLDNSVVEYVTKNDLIFPIPSARRLRFMDDRHPDKRNPNVLWRLLKSAVKGLNKINSNDFSEALKIPGVGVTNFTQALTLINATEFLSTDPKLVSLKLDNFAQAPTTNYQRENFSLEMYKEILVSVREIFSNCELYEVGLFTYLLSTKTDSLRNNFSKFYQVSTNVMNDGKDEWETFSENNCVFTGGEYPKLFEADRGSLVVVRNGEYNFYGIGLIIENEYLESEEWDEDWKIHVIWVNKYKGTLAERSGLQSGFTRVWNLEKIKTLEPYRRTIEKLEKLEKLIPPPPPPPPQPRNQILYGPPGTGKTWHTVNLSLAIVLEKNIEKVNDEDRKEFDEFLFNVSDDGADGNGPIAFTTFHQNYAYEDFIEGIRPAVKGVEIRYKIRNGIFKRLADTARDDPDQPYVLIIDEINRGNIAKIFGELITLIEDSKRLGESDEKTAILPYSQNPFGVPPNLYIIGTMNTADRSIQILDTALRRRFTFLEMMPNTSHEKIPTDIEGINCQQILESMNRRIDGLLDRERQIGHTYFFDVASVDQLAEVFQNRVIPLLQEYFFDDWSKIKAVLGKNAFVQDRAIDDRNLAEYRDSTDKYYERLPADDYRWNEPEQYRKIYQN